MTRNLTRPLTRGLTRSLVRGAGLDPDTTAFASASGATDLAGIDAIAAYMRGQGLRNNYRLYPQKSAQNAGSGSTVYGIGGLTANNMTLVNSPTWGAMGITLDGVNQYGIIDDFIDSSTLTVWARWKYNSLAQATSNIILSQAEFTTNKRSWNLNTRNDIAGDPLTLLRSVDGTAGGIEVFRESTSSFSTDEQMYVAQWVDGGGRGLWVNKSPQSLVLETGSARTSRFNADIAVMMGAQAPNAPVSFANARAAAVAFFVGSITTTQRETLTDLINAL